MICARERNPPGYVVHDPVSKTKILMDPGPGSWARLPHAGVDPRTVDRVFITHLHVDHHVDLLSLLFARYNPEWRKSGLPRIKVFGPKGTRRICDSWKELYGEAVDDPLLEIHEIGPGEHSIDHVLLKACRTRHTEESLAFSIEIPGFRSFCFTGDGGESQELLSLAKESHVLLCECSLPEEYSVDTHMTPAKAARLARDAGVKHLVLTHFYPEVEKIDILGEVKAVWDGPVHLARDLETFEL